MSDDALADWLDTRPALAEDALVQLARAAPLAIGRRDGHDRYIDVHDVARGPERSGGMREAVQYVRAAVRVGQRRLDLATLARAHAVALRMPRDVGYWRDADAFSKGGDERYGYQDGLRSRFHAALLEARVGAVDEAQDELPAIVRACRAYLDVCFFHPFVDGNARVARLAFDAVLFANGCMLDQVAPLFCVMRPAGDAEAHRAFVRLACTLAVHSHARAGAHHQDHQDAETEELNP